MPRVLTWPKDWRARWSEAALQGDGFSLILLAAPPTVVVGDPVFDREELADEIAELRRTDGGADLPATLAEIERVIDRAARREPRLQRRRICFFTDMGRTHLGRSVRHRNAVDSRSTGRQSRNCRSWMWDSQADRTWP